MSDERTLEQIQADLKAVNDEILTIVQASGAGSFDYSVGPIRVDKSKHLRELRALKKDLTEELQNYPTWEETVLDHPAL